MTARRHVPSFAVRTMSCIRSNSSWVSSSARQAPILKFFRYCFRKLIWKEKFWKLTMANHIFTRNPEERNALSSKHIAIVGCGSIGSTVADIATRTGVGTLTLIDPDPVSAENIGRHVLTTRDIGQHKVDALASHLQAINPDIVITRSMAHSRANSPRPRISSFPRSIASSASP